MPKDHEKYVARLPKLLRVKLNEMVDRVKILNLQAMDVKKLQGFENIFRV